MIIIKEDNVNKAWRNSLKALYDTGYIPQDTRFSRMDTLIIEMISPKVSKPDPLFPISKGDINTINKFITTGECEEKVCHEWTKLYYHRLFDNPYSQIEYMIDRIKNNRMGIACNWIKEDQKSNIKPCMLSITANNENGKLNFQLHARACNIYDKLLMNLLEFITLQNYLATKLALEPGRFTMFIDYAQISMKDSNKVEYLIQNDFNK